MDIYTAYDNNVTQYLTQEGNLTSEGLPVWQSYSKDQKVSFYRWMLLARLFDKKAVLLQRQGRIGTYASLEGQEAAQVGSSLALTSEDWCFPSYREHAVSMVVGMPLAQIFLYWMGRVEGCKPPAGIRLLPPSVPIATQILHAVGSAWASKLRKEKSVSVAYFGDGATSEGDFHEACNFAGIFKVPIILFCQNNGYAISMPFSKQSSASTVAQRASAYNFPGLRVDGNDVLAVHDVVLKAVESARSGDGPTLIEAITYRVNSHTTADDADKYRGLDEVSMWRKHRDPLYRYKKLLQEHSLMTNSEEKDLIDDCESQINDAIRIAETQEDMPGKHLFKHIFGGDLNSSLKRQLDQVT